MKKVLICGATGFIGRNLVEFYSKQGGYEVHAVWHKRKPYNIDNVIWHQADLRDAGSVEQLVKDKDIVIQAAATTSGSKDIVTKPYIHVTDNAVMNSLLLRACYDFHVKHFVFFSCTVMYQSSDKALKESDWKESDEIFPRYFGVGWTKVYVEKMCEFFSRLGRTKHTVIRHSNIYGPHDKFDLERSHVFGATVTKVMQAKDKITVWGTGEESRDLLYVDDLMDFIDKSIEKQQDSYALYNCGLGKAITIKDLVHTIVKASGKNLNIEHDLSQPTIKTSLFLDCKKAKTELGWEPSTSLDKGIEKTIQWWKCNMQ